MLRRLGPLVFFCVVTVLAFWKVIFHREFTLLTGGDVAAAYYPWFDVAAYWLKKGVFLLWDPYVYCGKVFMGEPQAGLYYPLNWLFMLFPSGNGGMSLDAMQALLILDYLLLACFFYLMARSLDLSPHGSAVASVAFMLGGYTVHIYGYVNILSGFVWTPLTFLCYRRALLSPYWRPRLRWLLGSGGFLALTFLPGHHIPTVHTGLFLFFYTVWHLARAWRQTQWKGRFESVAVLGSVAATSVLLSALQWLPSVQWARQVYRWIGNSPPVKWGDRVPYSALQDSGNISPQDVVSIVLPYVTTNANLYTGAIVVFLGLIGVLFVRKKETPFFAVALFLYFFLSWGRFSALHGWINTFVPGMWFAREVFHYLIPFQLCLALLAGWGLDHIVESCSSVPDRRFRGFMQRAGWAMGALVIAAGILAVNFYYHQNLSFEHPYLRGTAGLMAYVSILGILLYLLLVDRIHPRAFRLAVIGLIVLDLTSEFSANVPLKQRSPEEQSNYVRAVWKKHPAAEYLTTKAANSREYFRVDDPTNIFPPNYGDVWRLPSLMGHGATALVDYFEFRGSGWGPGSNATALLNARYIPSRVPVRGMKRIFESGNTGIYVNPRAVPRAFVSSRFLSFSGKAEMLAWIRNPLFSPRNTVLLLDQDVRALSAPFAEALTREHEATWVSGIVRRTAAEKEAVTLTDPLDRHRLDVFQAPWGWSIGDELSFRLHPDRRVDHCYVVLEYYPTQTDASRLELTMEGPAGLSALRLELPGLETQMYGSETLRQIAVDLGCLQSAPYQLSVVRTEACSANLDSLRISSTIPAAQEASPGTVEISSLEPNRLALNARIVRPTFVVVSEVFYPGWEALVDGQPVPLLEADYILRAVPVPAGQHIIELRYRPASLKWGLAASLISVAGVVLFLVLTRQKTSGVPVG
jgi:Bacterial membrane protein YfhO